MWSRSESDTVQVIWLLMYVSSQTYIQGPALGLILQ
nr:MAG TPA: hypothetical protein [Caudoviricetes sp.]